MKSQILNVKNALTEKRKFLSQKSENFQTDKWKIKLSSFAPKSKNNAFLCNYIVYYAKYTMKTVR